MSNGNELLESLSSGLIAIFNIFFPLRSACVLFVHAHAPRLDFAVNSIFYKENSLKHVTESERSYW